MTFKVLSVSTFYNCSSTIFIRAEIIGQLNLANSLVTAAAMTSISFPGGVGYIPSDLEEHRNDQKTLVET